MKKIFLTSSFAEVKHHFPKFINDNLQGKTISFIPTASLVEEIRFYVDEDREALKSLGLVIDELDISALPSQVIQEKLKQNDYIFVSGGNTFYLLQELRKSGADQFIIEQIQRGKPYIGSSAGSIILAPDIKYIADMDDKNKATQLDDYSGLDMINFYPLPHYANEPFQEITHKIFQEFKQKLKLTPLNNDEYIQVIE
ncbi:Type 1 glutamine amidotransferase-like domain-containing protein [Acinetobacter stercoris]|uniref:Putative peptidase n=1 Tax=Acinetobacter stercoris TaxID=2126983 RepID=A0A2U3N0D9_9GAMM|nr:MULTISPECIES: Type 1 glutamine amidotransferase-like domain-containing protein [Acinetobacter]SPL71114.1 putative peptidase [Acinetobacter stercoris]